MPIWLKVVLIIVLTGTLVVGAVGVGGYIWFQKNSGRIKETAVRITAEGKAFGDGKSSSDCVDESLARVRACDGVICEAKVRLFMDACLRASTRQPGFCEAVPPKSEIFRTVQWSLTECIRHGLAGDPRCSRLMNGLAAFCQRR